MNKTHHEIYKFDTKGKVRVWYMEQEGGKHRTWDGIQGGKVKASEWTVCVPTNVGRSNERDAVAQATFEIEAAYQKKLTREYHLTLEGAGGGAHFFKPMLAEKYEEFKPGYAQPKLDGIRCIAKADGLWSRQGKPITGVPHIVEALTPLFAADPKLVLDGELYNHSYKDDFNSIVSAVKKKDPSPEQIALAADIIQYHVYDLPSHSEVFAKRSLDLIRVLSRLPTSIQFVETLSVETAEEYDELHGAWIEKGFEGSIYRANEVYEQKRSKHLRKRKDFQDDEFEVIEIQEGIGNWSGVAKIVLCKLPDGRDFGAGIKGNRERAAVLLKEKHKIVTIRFFNYTPDGIPRFPVAIKFHGEKREF